MAAEKQSTNRKKEVGKGNRRMPWLSKAKKDDPLPYIRGERRELKHLSSGRKRKQQ